MIYQVIRRLLGRYRTLPESQRLEMLRDLGNELVPDYRFTWPGLDWWNDAGFNEYLESTGQLGEFNSHRRWMVSQLLKLTDGVQGDTAECGVYRGDSSLLIVQRNRKVSPDRTHHMFDSFEGLSTAGTEDGAYWSGGDLAVSEGDAVSRIGTGDDVRYYKGWIPKRFDEVAGRKFSFVHVDVDLHEPTQDSIRFFYPLLNPGGILLCDDYGIGTCPGATRAMDEFMADKPEKIVALAAGSGFIIKGTSSASANQPLAR